jgi:preprotein translocase subunit SecA
MRRFANDRVQGLMRTLGFSDDVALESKMVSRTIEGAQSRVEGYNFDTRKHVVQYDDVINRQRETIYRERDRILRASDLSPTVLAMLEDEVAALVAEHTAAEGHTEWNRDGLKAQIAAMVPTLTPADLRIIEASTEAAELVDRLTRLVHEHYDRKRTDTGEPGINVLERLVLLRVIDSLWVEHLTAIDDMRRGIGLRAYSQRDPLNEFKVEAYRMFDELKATIRRDVTHTIFRVSVTTQPQIPRAMMRNVTEGRPAVGAPGAAATATATAGAATMTASGGNGARQPVRAERKIGRNDPCWCGSGKKFKRCHGA